MVLDAFYIEVVTIPQNRQPIPPQFGNILWIMVYEDII